MSFYVKADVFPASYAGGNPLGVILDGDNWSDEQMQKFAKWSDIVETTYVMKPTNPIADYKVRIFMTTKEIPFAGHPTIGTAYALIKNGMIAPKSNIIYQECGNGIIPILVDGEKLFLRSPDSLITQSPSEENIILSEILENLPLGKLPPALIDGGRKWWVAEIGEEQSLRNWIPTLDKIKVLANTTNSMGICLFSKSTNPDGDYDIVVRAFPGGVGIIEDPASGAANGLIGSYILKYDDDYKDKTEYTVSQGREMGFDAKLIIRFFDNGVWVGGNTNIIHEGKVFWPQN